MKNGKLIMCLGLAMLVANIQIPVHAEIDNDTTMDCWQGISQEDKDAFMARNKERWEKLKEMTPEEREAFHDQWMAEKMEGMSPEQQEKFKARMEKRREMRKKMQEMTPEQQEKFKARMEKRREIHEKMQKMTPEERVEFRNQWMAEKMEGMTPEEQTAFKARMKKREEMSRKRCEAIKAEMENRR